jgi:hypothetical protein
MQKSGNVLWDIAVDDYRKGFSITHAPPAIDGKIIVGVTSGECALTGLSMPMTPAQGGDCGEPIRRLNPAIPIARPGIWRRRRTLAVRLPG